MWAIHFFQRRELLGSVQPYPLASCGLETLLAAQDLTLNTSDHTYRFSLRTAEFLDNANRPPKSLRGGFG